jgi:hypothetical protein
MKLRTLAGFTVLAYALSSPPLAASITQLALAPFGDTSSSPDPAHASASDADQSALATPWDYTPRIEMELQRAQPDTIGAAWLEEQEEFGR